MLPAKIDFVPHTLLLITIVVVVVVGSYHSANLGPSCEGPGVLGVRREWMGVIAVVLALGTAGVALGIHQRSQWAIACWAIAMFLLAPVVSRLLNEVRGRNWRDDRANIHQIAIAMLQYEQKYGCFPPAYLSDRDGKPMHSWRVLLLPFLERDDLYNAYDFSEPWDGPNNRRLFHRMPPQFSWRQNAAENDTAAGFLVVVGISTLFPGPTSFRFQGNVADLRSSTLLVVQCANSGITWTEPRDLNFDEIRFTINADAPVPSIRSDCRGGVVVAFADGHTEFLERNTSADVVQRLITGNAQGAEAIKDR